MHITLVGISHKTAPVAVRERFAFAAEELPEALPRLGGAAVLLSTCNRTEVYVTAHHPITSGSVISLLRELKDADDTPDEAFYHLTDLEAAQHLFRVAAGIDSMVVGESEILGQVRSAFAAAGEAGTQNAVLSRLFHGAIRSGRRVRSETHINRHAVSVSSSAVALARKTLGTLECRTVLVVSAGGAGKLAARSLRESGASKLLVTSRTAKRAKELAGDLEGEAVPFSRISHAIEEADIVISSSAAPDYLIDRDAVGQAVANRNGRPLLMIDIAVPRDIDPAVREFEQVHLFDIDDLQGIVQENMGVRRREATKAEHIIEEELGRFRDWLRSRGVVPTVAALRSRAEALSQEEAARTLKRSGDFTPQQQRKIEAMANAIVKKLLHDPIDALKGDDGERYVATVRDLFHLDSDEADPEAQEPEA
ncbi:MAG: glutamyl-tRNA reductase [Conexibacter sp.]